MQKRENPNQAGRRALEPRAVLRQLADETAPQPPRVGGIWKPAAPRPRGDER